MVYANLWQNDTILVMLKGMLHTYVSLVFDESPRMHGAMDFRIIKKMIGMDAQLNGLSCDIMDFHIKSTKIILVYANLWQIRLLLIYNYFTVIWLMYNILFRYLYF